MENNTLPTLTKEEIRVLGCLIEKSKTTPEYYPLTLKGLTTACNQKSARNPVVDYSEDTVVHTLDALRKKGLAATVVGGSSRVTKYKHTIGIKYPLVPAAVSILSLLMLRGPLTVGEIKANSGRLFPFDSLEEIQDYLQELSEAQPPYVTQIEKKSGQKEARYIQLFSDVEEQETAFEERTTTSGETLAELSKRVEILEEELSDLRERFEKLMEELS